MPSDGSVTNWMKQFRDGDTDAAQFLWERYYERLVRLACRKLKGSPRRMADEEDVAIVAFENFLSGIQDGRFPKLEDRNDLWQILVMLTDRKAKDAMRRDGRRRKHEIGESAVAKPSASASDSSTLDQLLGDAPTPESAAQMIDDVRRMLDCLGDDGLRQIALLKLEGYSNERIAAKIGRVSRTVDRKLNLIRERWREMANEQADLA